MLNESEPDGNKEIRGQRQPARQGARLLDLPFLVNHVFAYHRVEFHDFHLVRHVAFVFGGGVEMSGAGG